ncbi:DUF1697 domain-containing protein [Streptococcus suis]|uniref:Uncharacterized protein conserved in bacteria n=2 Tax=Streptococcus suis TaxID=1307 RepID=A0A0Z8JSJ5_STRSU|nr:DUF1697 domain-containing protein [Streptococcus suis]AGZ24148.1 hypothetical protein T15_2072 [Streptococcus suis T15]MCG9861681.1 DUF1697 domain-containing protein [Streptococcus suis]MCG9864760.1 DUF1697 domain-containing protein [Streptococcus suis]MCG9865208.1 DUF1697 domain-containing protein [Streptococcus suis]MCG9867838.1 DUF1697 domain-containing protein [Streptococcus suis]
MSYLAERLTEVGLTSVQTYIQSGNVVCETDLSDEKLSQLIHQTIKEKIGAELAIIVKHQMELVQAVAENPFGESYDSSRVHLVFTNDEINGEKLNKLLHQDFGNEELCLGSQCLYMYLPRDARKKKLNTNFLEKQLGLTVTMRKLSVISRLSEMAK